ncbi:MAG: ferredoxin reductase [Rhizobiaceae bacterium]
MTEGFATPALAWQQATIERVETRSRTLKSFFLRPSSPFDHLAGQHVELRLTAPDGYQARRAYSIASAPGESEAIELGIDLLQNGEVSPYFHEVAAVGDEIEMRGPIGGHFIWRPEDGGPMLLVAGGSGIVPLLSIARHRARTGSAAPMLLLYSARTAADLAWGDELATFAGEGAGFQLAVTLTRETPANAAWLDRRIDSAMVRDCLERLPALPVRVYICGSNAFVGAAADGVIDAGVPPDIVRTERYGE